MDTLNCINISQYYWFYCMEDQIKADLVQKRLKKILLNGSVFYVSKVGDTVYM